LKQSNKLNTRATDQAGCYLLIDILLLLNVYIRPKTKRFRPLSDHPQCQ